MKLERAVKFLTAVVVLERTVKFFVAVVLVATALFIGGMFVAMGPGIIK